MNLLLLKNYILKDLLKIKKNKQLKSADIHLGAAIHWLCLAQDSQNDGGVSIRYSLAKGWQESYPETTGYIIPTFINYASYTNQDIYSERAVRMANWLLSIQKEDGSFNGGPVRSGYDSFVFDTGQIVFGLTSAYKFTNLSKYIKGAVKAGRWLVKVQEPGGMWKKYAYHSISHTYYTMVAWALAELGKCVNENAFINAASKNVDWALSKQKDNGWFDETGFTVAMHPAPYTHNIAYTMQGILETGTCLGRNDYIEGIIPSADSLCDAISKHNFCFGTYDLNWNSSAKYSCLTGDAQIAMILLRLYEMTRRENYLAVARSLTRFLCETQVVDCHSPVNGAIGGSYPTWGRYERFAFPNWATKFFVDALLLERKILTLH